MRPSKEKRCVPHERVLFQETTSRDELRTSKITPGYIGEANDLEKYVIFRLRKPKIIVE